MNQTQSKVLPIVRRPEFDHEGSSKHYANGNPLITHLINAGHAVFPDGEKLFIRAVNAYRDMITDPELKARVKAFIGQEVQHGKTHEEFWDQLQEQGVDVQGFRKFYVGTGYDGLEKMITKFFGPAPALAVTVALEHYTAMLAEVALTSDLLKGLPADMRNMLEWHAAEEIEHKAVTFDVMAATEPSHALRAWGFIIGSWGLSFYLGTAWAKFLIEDKDIDWSKMPAYVVEFAQWVQPMLKGLPPQMLAYFREDFHPDEMDNNHLAEKVFGSPTALVGSAS